jgi:hypothetical protein
MKKKTNILLLTLFALSGITLTSCEENWLHDVIPFDINIIVEDANGNNLLNPEFEENIIDKITITYNDETYKIEKDKENVATRALPSKFYGLRHFCSGSGRHFMTFGNFVGECNYKNEKITIHWGNGTSDEVTFTNKVKGGSHTPKLDITRTIKLNGQKINPDIDITPIDILMENPYDYPNGRAFVIVH